jgi:hypothetical protein
MNIASDAQLNETQGPVESAREENPAEQLVELGRVSETKGGWFGSKQDAGAGLTVY